jgi:hypothetical protein
MPAPNSNNLSNTPRSSTAASSSSANANTQASSSSSSANANTTTRASSSSANANTQHSSTTGGSIQQQRYNPYKPITPKKDWEWEDWRFPPRY